MLNLFTTYFLLTTHTSTSPPFTYEITCLPPSTYVSFTHLTYYLLLPMAYLFLIAHTLPVLITDLPTTHLTLPATYYRLFTSDDREMRQESWILLQTVYLPSVIKKDLTYLYLPTIYHEPT